MNIGQAIRHLRKEKASELNQSEFSKKIGVTQSYLSLIELGKRKPSIELLESISDYFKIPLPILFWFTVDESDIDKNKKDAYNILKPSIDSMIEMLINEV